MSSDKIIDWKVVYEDVNPLGSFTCQIVWLPPAGDGFIVQHVSVDDPMRLLPNYDRPYFEAWKVLDGEVIHEGCGSNKYDDSFTNCWDGMRRQSVGDNNADKIKEEGLRYSHVSFNCRVFWVERGSEAYETVDSWKLGKEIGITMAGNLRASYDVPSGLDEGKGRLFTANFDTTKKTHIKINKVEDQIVINGDEGTEIVPNKASDNHVPVVYQEGNEVYVKVGMLEQSTPCDHCIEWFLIETATGSYQKKDLKPGEKPEVVFTCLEKVIAAYALCNPHGLWKNDNVAYIEHRTI